MVKSEVVLNGVRTRYKVPIEETYENRMGGIVDGEDFGFCSIWRRVRSPHYNDELKGHPDDKAGKWLIFINNTREDFLKHWSRIKVATLEGKLGVAAKIAKPGGRSKRPLVICVYTGSYADVEDVMRVREALRALGYDKTLPYKPDYETLTHRYGSDTILYRA